jgi:hypothetical protein
MSRDMGVRYVSLQDSRQSDTSQWRPPRLEPVALGAGGAIFNVLSKIRSMDGPGVRCK